MTTEKQEEAREHFLENIENARLARLANQPGERPLEETAKSLLWSPDFFPKLVADIQMAGLVNERRNALATWIIGTSRLRRKPLNEIVKGVSSAGKNHLVKTVFKFFPRDAVVRASSLSERAIQYAGKSLKHKIFYLDELTRMNHPLRQLISEGRTIHKVTEMHGKERVLVEYVTEGPVCGITTTTENALKIDDETRNFSLWINESYDQTKAISKALVSRELQVLSPARLAIWHEVQHRVAKISDVSVSTPLWFEDIVEKILPYGDVRIRRYWPAFLEACKVITLIRAATQTEKELQDGVTVKFQDFATAVCIFDKVIGESLTRAGRDEDMATADTVDRISRRLGQGVAAEDLVGEPGIRSLDRAYRLLRRANQAGTIYWSNLPGKNNEKRYMRREPTTFLGRPEVIVRQIGLRISGMYVHPITGKHVTYPFQ